MDFERRNKILELKDKCYSYKQICDELNCDKSLVAYYCGENKWQKKKETILKKEESKKEYEDIICELVKNNDNIHQVCILLGKRPTNMNYIKIRRIIDKYNIDTSHFKNQYKICAKKHIELDDVLCKNSEYKNISNLRNRLIKSGIKEEKCECCGNSSWMGDKIPLELHHINGIRDDNRLENLQILCPNCHALTDNYCKRNHKTATVYIYKTNICPVCQKEFSGGNKFCSKECYEKNKNKKREEKGKITPTKETILIAAQEEKTMRGIEKRFGMGDNCIRKWCDKFGLPRKIKDLKAFAENFLQ